VAVGPKRDVLTAPRVSDAFGASLSVDEVDGLYYARANGTPAVKA
jgi:hypothetical protein